jgi:3',5'-cyclic-nucleotide phosphodiesterase
LHPHLPQYEIPDADGAKILSAAPIPDERKRQIEAEVAKWQFCAHDFTDDELVYAATSMIAHALQLPELEPWRISTGKLYDQT